jgi:sugar (pentulose or hexulose) kinase
LPFVGIDLGTSFIKGAVLDTKTCRIEHIRRIPFPEPLAGLNPLYCEFDPEPILTATRRLIEELVMLAGECAGVVMCNQMSSMLLMNRQGQAVSKFLGWRDQRALQAHPSEAGSYYQVLQQRVGAQHRRELGNEMPVGAPICFLFWLGEQGKLEPGLIPVSLGDFVVSSLCNAPPSVDATNAMAYELLNLSTLQWHFEVIEALGLSALHWPTLRRQGDVAGSLQISGRSVPCYTPVGDYQCALLGALLCEDELSLNISTGSQASRIIPDLVLGEFQTRPFFDRKFTNTVSHLPAGRSLNVLVDLLTEIGRAEGKPAADPWSYIAAAAAAADDTDLQIKLSFYPGPCGNSGSIGNISEKTLNVGTLFRAAFADMAECYYASAVRIWPGSAWRSIVFSGGLPVKLPLLRQMIQARFQADARQSPVAEDTLLGLLLLAKTFSGEAPSVEQAAAEFRERSLQEQDEGEKANETSNKYDAPGSW